VHIAICIVGYRNAEDVVRCIEALRHITYSDFRVIICENGGADASRSLAALLPSDLNGRPVEVISAPDNPGYAGGVNRCIQAQRAADAWWILNPDTVPEPHSLQRMVERLARGDCDAVGATLHDLGGIVQSYGGRWRRMLARAETVGRGASLDDLPDPSAIEAQLNFISGASMLVGRRFVDTAGLMREDYFLYCEEVEWCLRAQNLSLRLGFAPDALVLHNQGSTTGSADHVSSRPRLPIYLDERNKLNVVRDTRPADLPVSAAAAFLLIGMRFARRGAWRQWRYALSGWLAGLRNERGKPHWVTQAGS